MSKFNSPALAHKHSLTPVPKVYDALEVENGLTLEVQQQIGDGVVPGVRRFALIPPVPWKLSAVPC